MIKTMLKEDKATFKQLEKYGETTTPAEPLPQPFYDW